MTSWVLTIASDYPQHWDIAKEELLWDMTNHRQIEQDDVVYFWLAGHNQFLGPAEVARPAARLSGDEKLPWHDDGERRYRTRIHFSWAADAVVGEVRWKEVQEQTGITQGLNTIPHTADPRAEEWLASLFEPVDEIEATFGSEDVGIAGVRGPDTRKRLLRPMRERRGQPAFRSALLRAYAQRCAVTGSTTKLVLEAAHIQPYRGEHTNVVPNGLLLRSDIHTLFDLHQLTVVKEGDAYRVRVSPDLDEDLYRALDHQPLAALPVAPRDRPGNEVLEQHNQRCEWLTPSRIDLFPTQ
ncbi:HNH endonuclease [Pseudactinotalea sp. Z1748]|uniref:HNH endonuclease n=1 Tax=Pseudactinotalea sp. Z1748 TaxID=3413027 RepID=UPI003C79FB5B